MSSFAGMTDEEIIEDFAAFISAQREEAEPDDGSEHAWGEVDLDGED